MTNKIMKTLIFNNGNTYEIVDEKSRNDIKKINETMRFYNAINYGISTENEDNTPALQSLIDLVHENGGGTIFFPIGTYAFKRTGTVASDANNSEYSILAKSNVSIVGENLRQTILKQVDGTPYSLFYCHGTPENPIIGCTYRNFTVDAYDTGDVNAVYGKAFYYQYVRDCRFYNLLLRGTVATALGIDYLDRVRIEFVNTVDCGRTFTGIESGSSGIGIGTGGWKNENFFVHNCICKASGQYGIFIENQFNLGWGGTTDFSKGCIISNCITQGGLNKGIGVCGGQNVTVIGCESYDNAADGIFIDGKCKNVKVISCNTANNGGNGIEVNTTQESSKVVLSNNMIDSNALNGIFLSPTVSLSDMVVKENTVIDNVQNGINVTSDIKSLVLMNNYVVSDENALSIGEHSFNDCVIKNNVFWGGINNNGIYTRNNTFNDFITAAPTSISANDIEMFVGSKKQIDYSALPINSSSAVVFVSSDENVATVNNIGKITGVNSGSCTIEVISSKNESVKTSINCIVNS